MKERAYTPAEFLNNFRNKQTSCQSYFLTFGLRGAGRVSFFMFYLLFYKKILELLFKVKFYNINRSLSKQHGFFC